MTLRLNGATSGFTEIDAPAVAGNNTLSLPGGNGTADQALVTNGSGTLSFADRGRMVLETAKNATGTFVDFTGIPSWVKRLTVVFTTLSQSGTASVLLQLGDSGGVETTGYTSTSNFLHGNTSSGTISSTAGIILLTGTTVNQITGSVVFNNINSNTWVATGMYNYNNTTGITGYIAGDKTLSNPLDRIRITSTNGTDTFAAGTINLLLEG